ncbi:MAG: hypothetical protein H7247_14470 [Polaromonas sp.]|nr:hypothetical protein [Gemmatimonadaceae bacterium]
MTRFASFLFCLIVLPAATRAPEPRTSTGPRKTVAILAFDNHTGAPDYDALGKGIASMMISDLSVIKEIQLLERDRMQDLINEANLQQTKYFDSTTAVTIGRMVGAEYVVVGAFATVKPRMRIDTRVVRVATGEIVKTAQVTGEEDKFFELQQALASKLTDGLGLALSPEEQARLAAQQEANRVDALSTMKSFSLAIDRYDARDYVGAMEHMVPATRGAPNAMFMQAALDEMKRRVADGARNKAKEKLKSGLGGLLRRP